VQFDGALDNPDGAELPNSLDGIYLLTSWLAWQAHEERVSQASARLLGWQDLERESPLDTTLALGISSGDRMDFAIQKATELGAKAIAPVYAEFTVVRIDDERLDRRIDHWRRIARSACEQCGRHTPPTILAPVTLNDGLHALPDDTTRLVLDPGASARFASIPKPAAGLLIAIGPEGGFAANDWRLLDAAGFARVTLGPRVLRAETAAVAACTIAQALWGDLGA